MGFDLAKFESATFKDRTEAVPVPRLAAFFGKKDQAVWVVRGLTGVESAIAKQAVQQNSNIEAVLKALGSKVSKEIAEAAEELTGTAADKVPDEMVQRYSWLVHGSVDPKCSHSMAMKLAKNYPEDFYLLTNKIMQLTGAGRLGE
jgi:predicted alpha/beta hydrolase family esterase